MQAPPICAWITVPPVSRRSATLHQTPERRAHTRHAQTASRSRLLHRRLSAQPFATNRTTQNYPGALPHPSFLRLGAMLTTRAHLPALPAPLRAAFAAMADRARPGSGPSAARRQRPVGDGEQYYLMPCRDSDGSTGPEAPALGGGPGRPCATALT
jgi:hypothetical protein